MIRTLKDNQSPSLNATGGIVVGASNLPSASSSSGGGGSTPSITVDLKQQAQVLSSQPSLSYLGDLAKRNDVAFQKVQLASQSWNYSESGLSTAGAAIIAVAVAAVTAGAASELSAAMVASAGLTGTSASIATAALTAGMTSLTSQAAVSLANNQGDLGKTLQDLGSSNTVKNLAAAMVTAGALEGLGNTIGFTGQSGSGSLTNSTSGKSDVRHCWLVSESVTLANGAVQNVLVPQVSDVLPAKQRTFKEIVLENLRDIISQNHSSLIGRLI